MQGTSSPFAASDPLPRLFIRPYAAQGTSASRRHRNGQTDKGPQGVLNFFKSHKCGSLCTILGLQMPDMTRLHSEANEAVRLCVVCMDKPRATRFGPCGHATCCNNCGTQLMQMGGLCPICRSHVSGIIDRGAHIALQFTLA